MVVRQYALTDRRCLQRFRPSNRLNSPFSRITIYPKVTRTDVQCLVPLLLTLLICVTGFTICECTKQASEGTVPEVDLQHDPIDLEHDPIYLQHNQIDLQHDPEHDLFDQQHDLARDRSDQHVLEHERIDLQHELERDRICPDEMFQCLTGDCFPMSYQCDGQRDCPDGSDEMCTEAAKVCRDFEFDCGGGKCIPSRWVCDSEIDCKETKADEDRAICHNYDCQTDQFTCHSSANGTLCIPLNWVCDNKADCNDSSDELSCNATCTSEQFTCASGKCVPLLWHCDGDNDCGDDSDERHCPPKACTIHEVKCPNGACIQRSWVCDGTSDCTDGWDEQASCDDGSCVMKSWFCDGEQDCPDHSDEKDCSNSSVPYKCSVGEVKCDRTLTCIKRSFLCDGEADCPDGEDESEEHCTSPACSHDEFKCGDTSCIPRQLVCNGFPECVDGADEKHCNVTKCDPEHQFDCGDHCIPMALVCNGKDDCGNGNDELEEELCGRNECHEFNGGCSQMCVDTKAGHYCACKRGFMLVDGTQCQDINECLEPGLCSQLCINLKGSYKCECVAGYAKDPHDTHRCKAMEGHASLLFADYYDIRKISLDHQEVTAIVNETDGSAALDFVFKTGMIFWTDAKDRCIYKAPIDEGQKSEKVISKDMTNTDGLSVDWIYNHIYWTNADSNTVEVADFNGDMRKTLFHKNLGEPRAIAIYPIEGWMFWTDWGAEAKIERAGMDGTHREAIVTRDIRWPNGLTVDFVLRKVIWVDSKKHTISSCDFDGSNRRVILSSKEHLPHPFSITVFEDTIYWTDWTKGAILKANKFSGSNLGIISHAHSSPMTVHVYHSYRQPNGTNHCTPLNGLCTHLCLPAPQLNLSAPKITCACPDGLMLMSDGLTCEREGRIRFVKTYESTVMEGGEQIHGLFMHDQPSVLSNERLQSPTMKKDLPVGDDVEPYLGSHPASQDNDEGSVAVAAILAAIVVLCLTSGVAYVIYRYYRKRSVHSMNFDNPVYKKTTTEDGFNMAGSNQRPSSSQNGVRPTQTPYQHRQYGVMSSEDSLEPLTKNHQFV